MLSTSLHELCLLLSTPYNNLDSISYDANSLDNSILENIYLKKLFDFKWRKKINSNFENFQFDYYYKVLEQNINFIKIKLYLTIFFATKSHSTFIPSACVHEYIFILERLQNKFKIRLLVESEKNPLLFNFILETELSSIDSSTFKAALDMGIDDISYIDLFYEAFTTSRLSFNMNNSLRNYSSFNINAACAYAETYALTPNPNYKSFEGIGGDCTNFMSQILYTGGILQTNTWKPYTNPWIRVEEFYLYLTEKKLGIKLPNDSFLDRGCLIQFYTPSIGRFFHNGFITYKLENNDCLYCCHSYNKLNYPLSEIYPNRYPKLRALKFI